MLVIELDDASHDRESAQARDAVKDRALDAAGLPPLRVPARRSYDPRVMTEYMVAMMVRVQDLGAADV
ncbi:MAG: DUF2726 domain-containing protein [Planctomycetota bacterium]